MTRDEYLKMRNENSYDLQLFFSIYKEKGGWLDYFDFNQVFKYLLPKVIEHLDCVFNVNRLESKEGKLLKAF